MTEENTLLFFRKLGFWLGFTKEIHISHSGPLEAEGTIIDKKVRPESVIQHDMGGDYSGIAREYIYTRLVYSTIIEKGSSSKEETEKFIIFGNKWYDSLEIGDKVKIMYHDTSHHVSDYVPPDFTHKIDSGPVCIGYTIEDIIKLD